MCRMEGNRFHLYPAARQGAAAALAFRNSCQTARHQPRRTLSANQDLPYQKQDTRWLVVFRQFLISRTARTQRHDNFQCGFGGVDWTFILRTAGVLRVRNYIRMSNAITLDVQILDKNIESISPPRRATTRTRPATT